MPKSAGQCTVALTVSAWPMALQNWPNSARTSAGLVWVTMSAPARVGSTRCMARWTANDVAWFTLAQPTASADATDGDADEEDADEADDTVEADDDPPDEAPEETVTEPHPASAEHSSTAITVPRTWRGDIMSL
jgi:hypothetical protein